MKITKNEFDKLANLFTALLNEKGQEINNPVPMVLDPDIRKPEPIQEIIKRMIKTTISDQAAQQGLETEEEANDFGVNDAYEDSIIFSGYEVEGFEHLMQEEVPPQEIREPLPENEEQDTLKDEKVKPEASQEE